METDVRFEPGAERNGGMVEGRPSIVIEKCPLCSAPTIRDFLLRENVPVHQNLVFEDRQSALQVARGDLDLVVCETCGFVFNRAFDITKIQYGPDYDNAQFHSPSFSAYLDDLVDSLVREKGVRDCQIVEVGCGQGDFLRRIVEYPESKHGFRF